MSVSKYISYLSGAGFIGALIISGYVWVAFNQLDNDRQILQRSLKASNELTNQHRIVLSFTSDVEMIFGHAKYGNQNDYSALINAYPFIFGAKNKINQIFDLYHEKYSDERLWKISGAIESIEKNLNAIDKITSDSKASNNDEKLVAIDGYNNAKQILEDEIKDLKNHSNSYFKEIEIRHKQDRKKLEDRKEQLSINLLIAGFIYFSFLSLLSFLTYRSIARPLRNLEKATTRSIDQQTPFTLKEDGPREIRSLTNKLQGLIIGLEEKVLSRTIDLQNEIKQRKELETQLVHAQKMEAVGQLASGIAHEINSPSQFASDNILFLKEAVDGFISRITNPQSAPDEKELTFLIENAPGAVEQANEGISRITTIVKSMKNFAYRDAASEKKPNDLNQAIKSTIVVATNEWKYHADVITNLEEALPMVPCNIGEINQVVLNLIVNGSHAIRDRFGTKEKGTINITTKYYTTENCVIIAIADNGGGIPKKVQDRIFEPFFTTKEVGVGTGQGLAIAHNVINKSHNGQIWFQTAEGQGTVFYIKLPMDID